MKTVLVLFSFFHWTISNGQIIPYDNYTVDTLHLEYFNAKSIIAYNFDSVTFYVDYEDYKKEFYSLWETYHNGIKERAKAKRKGYYYNKDYEKRWPFIDSVYSVLTRQIKERDTIYLSHKLFFSAGLSDLNDFFPNLIEKNKCTITNAKGERQTILIRQKGSHIKGAESFGGRRYFLVGHLEYFIEATDWET
jgi:hypothetical protein